MLRLFAGPGFFVSFNIIRMIRSRRMRVAGHVAQMGRWEVHTCFSWGSLRIGGQFEDIGVNGTIILNGFQEIRWGRDKGMDGIYLALDRKKCRAVANTVMNFGFSHNAGHFVTRWEPVSFSRTILLPGVGEWVNEITDNLGQGWP
jgi:hypothetical protein